MKKIGNWIGAFLLVSLLLTCECPTITFATGTVRYAKPTGGLSTGTCGTWATACSLQYAIAVAVSGDQVWVQQGTYSPGTVRTDTFQLKNGVKIYGGFLGTESMLSQRNPVTHVTTLSGQTIVGKLTIYSYHVVTGSGTNSSAVLDGFTVTGGKADGLGGGQISGGGMYNNNGSPTVTNVKFQNNQASFGGGIANYGSSPVLTNVTFLGDFVDVEGGGMYSHLGAPHLTKVTFTGNWTNNGDGGGMYNDFSSPVLVDATFSANWAEYDGGGLYNVNGTQTLTRVTFSGNTAYGRGGGMYNSGTPTLTNVTFSANHATDASVGEGGGLYNGHGNTKLTNVTFSGNSATVRGGAMDNESSVVKIYDSIFWGDGSEIFNFSTAPVIKDSDVQGVCPSGATCTHVIHTNPKLGPLANNGGFTKTKALLKGSPAINTGNNLTCAKTDQRGVHRPQGPKCDMGAYEKKP